jgi:sugar/nucleoside kinase (ribokinase family)
VFYGTGALARLEADARAGAACAAEDRGLLLPPLKALGLPVTWYESRTTTAYRFHYEGDSRVMLQDAVGDPWRPEQALEAVGEAGWIHVGALVRTDFPEDTLAALAGGGRRLLVDAQGLVRTAEIGPLRTDGDVGDVLRYVAILKLDREEAATLAGSAEPDALRTLGVPEVLLTLGSEGSVVIDRDQVVRLPAPDVADRVDPTGAGDTFAAAYLAARAAGRTPVEAAERATATVAAFLSQE